MFGGNKDSDGSSITSIDYAFNRDRVVESIEGKIINSDDPFGFSLRLFENDADEVGVRFHHEPSNYPYGIWHGQQHVKVGQRIRAEFLFVASGGECEFHGSDREPS